MTIILKNKVSLIFDNFIFQCVIGIKGLTKNKIAKQTIIFNLNFSNMVLF